MSVLAFAKNAAPMFPMAFAAMTHVAGIDKIFDGSSPSFSLSNLYPTCSGNVYLGDLSA